MQVYQTYTELHSHTHTHTSTLTTSIMAMQIMRQALCSESTLVFIPACGQSIKEKVVGHPSCFAVLLKQHTGNQTHVHTHMPSSVTLALFLLRYIYISDICLAFVQHLK